jgi:hypothetical protein
MSKEKYTPELWQAICERIATSKDSLVTICKGCGIDYSTFRKWMHDDDAKEESERKGLSSSYARAKESQADYLADLMIEVAFEDGDDEKPFVGTNHIQRDRLKVDTLKFIASKLKPRKYGDKIDVTTDGKEIKHVDLTQLVGKFMTDEGDSEAEASV